MNQMDFVKQVDKFFYDLAKGYFTVFYGTEWYTSKIKGHMEQYAEDDDVMHIYKAFLNGGKDIITEEDSEVCMNLIFNDKQLKADMERKLVDDWRTQGSSLFINGEFSAKAREVFAVRRNCEDVTYSESELKSFSKALDCKSFFCLDIAQLISKNSVFKAYVEEFGNKYLREYDKALIPVMKKYNFGVKCSEDADGSLNRTFCYLGDTNSQIRSEVEAQINGDEETKFFADAGRYAIFSVELEHILVGGPNYKSSFVGWAETEEGRLEARYNIFSNSLSCVYADSTPRSAEEIQIILAKDLINAFILEGYDQKLFHEYMQHEIENEEKRITEILKKYKENSCFSTGTSKNEKKAEQSNAKPDVNKKIEEYFVRVDEYMRSNRLEDAATNVRHILELIVNTYIEKYSPEDVFLKTFDKIEVLKAKKIINEASTDTLHQIRKIANKGAHGESSGLTANEINLLIPPLKKEVQVLYRFMGVPKENQGVNVNNAHGENSTTNIQCPTCNKLLDIRSVYNDVMVSCASCNSYYLFVGQSAGRSCELKRIVYCNNCKMRLSVPVRDTKLIINCSNCHHEFLLMPNGSIDDYVSQNRTDSNRSNKQKPNKKKLFDWLKRH